MVPTMAEQPLNEWLFDEYIAKKDALNDLITRHENLLNHLADVCRRNDRMQTAGDELASYLEQGDALIAFLQSDPSDQNNFVAKAIQKWRESNV